MNERAGEEKMEFKQRLTTLAKRSVDAAPRCANEESTKMFLVLPMISLLGYDHTNPDEVFPEHHCDFSEKYKNRVDFAILREGSPVIAVECKPMGVPMKDDRGQLRSYFNAAMTVKMGILTDGLLWEFYADSDEPNMMDQQPFLTFDMREIGRDKLNDSVVDALQTLTKSNFDPENIGAEAKRKHVYNSVLQQIASLYREPTEPFTKSLLQNADLSRVSRRVLDDYRPVIQSAFREFINQQILQRLDLPQAEAPSPAIVSGSSEQPTSKVEERPSTTELELSVYRWVQHRLVFLVDDDTLFAEIGNVQFRDYQGKLAIFYKMERKGRLFDSFERKGGNGETYRFVFPDDLGSEP
jgi:hypothetical protein